MCIDFEQNLPKIGAKLIQEQAQKESARFDSATTNTETTQIQTQKDIEVKEDTEETNSEFKHNPLRTRVLTVGGSCLI